MKTNLSTFFIIAITTIMITVIKADLKCYKRPPVVSTDQCCPLPNFYSAEIKEKCQSNENHFKLDIDHQHLCFISCAIKEIGVFNDGEFIEDNLNSYLNTALASIPDIIEIVKSAFNICVEKYAPIGKIIIKEGKCSLYHVLIMDCVFLNTLKACPDSIWSNTEQCNEIRDYWKKCLPKEL